MNINEPNWKPPLLELCNRASGVFILTGAATLMSIEVNHKSIVIVGGFNPSILTPDFLTEHCTSFRPEQEPSGKTTPVMSEIVYGNVRLTMELNRFQIVVTGSQDLSKVFPLDVMEEYLRVLAYTPITLMGVNLNYTLGAVDVQKISAEFKDSITIEQQFGDQLVSIASEVRRPNGGNLFLSDVTFVRRHSTDLKISSKLTFEQDSIHVNNNFEVNGLDKDRERVHLLSSFYDQLMVENNKLVRALGGTSNG